MNFLRWPAQASIFAADVDRLFIFLCLVSTVAVLVIAGFILYFCIRYRRGIHPQPVATAKTSVGLEVGWSLVALLFFLVAFGWGARIYLQMYQTAPKDAYTVYVMGKQWMWKFQHPNGRREINELHIPVHRPIRIQMISQDVIHSLYIPAFRIKHDVLPMAYTELWFEATEVGAFHIFCAEYCGTSHAGMIGEVRVMQEEDFQTWLQTSSGMGSSAARGAQLSASLGCNSCHRSDSNALAPWFGGIYGQPVDLADGTRTVVDESYIREAILHPDAQLVRNYKAVMPSYAGRVSEDEILSLIAYIQSLREQNP